jgi:D-lactate dehydrogenase (cytochrome)
MNSDGSVANDRIIETLKGILGPDAVITDPAERRFYSTDVYSEGTHCAAAIRPKDVASLSRAVGAATKAGYAVIGRGGGMSYTNGYTPVRADSITVDVGALNRIIEINAQDMYITVEAGVTWAQIYEALKPLGLRLPFFGTFSGVRATVGGGLSQGALFMGTARYGQGADIVLGLEVVLADGTVVKTGQAGFRNGKPFYRTYGPDLTGMFIHDGGAFGIKTQATLRLIEAPTVQDYGSFVFPDMKSTADALADIARSGAAEEAYVFDPASTKKNLESHNLAQDIKTLVNVVKGQGGLLRGLKEGAKLVAAGRDFIDAEQYSLHVVCAGRSAAAVAAELDEIRARAARHGGKEIANSIPKAVRANPFQPLNGVLGPKGDRWAALNAKVAHSDAWTVIERTEKLLDSYKAEMDANGVFMTRLMIAISNHAFSYEPVFHWFDEWLPVHKRIPEPAHLKSLGPEPAANPKARELVHKIRAEVIDLFAEFGASSNQIGKSYPYLRSLEPGAARLIRAFKAEVDRDGQLNPGVLGFN